MAALLVLFVCLQLVVDLQILKVFEPDATLRALPHFHDILLDMLEGIHFTYVDISR